MQVIVQHLHRKQFLQEAGDWTGSRDQAKQFGTALEAIGFCIRSHAKDVFLIGQNDEGQDVRLYPFGGDPAVKLELKRLRKSIRESQRLKAERGVIQGRIDLLLAESKEVRKQVPFKRRDPSDGKGPKQ